MVKTLGDDAIDTAERAHELSLSVPYYNKNSLRTPRGTPEPSDDENYGMDDKELLIPKK